MLGRLSNKALAFLVIIAMIVSILGTWSVVRNPRVTGYATNVTTQTGVASLNVLGNLVVEMVDNDLNITSELQIGDHTNSEVIDEFFVIQNSGSVDLDLKVYCEAGDCDLWDTVPTPNELYEIHCNSTTDAGATCNETYAPVPANSGDAFTIIEELGNTAGSRSVTIGINVTVPLLEDDGVKTASVIFLAVSTGGDT